MPDKVFYLKDDEELGQPTEQPAAAPTLWDRLGGMRGMAGTGIRALSGILGAEGGWTGAGIGGGGEFLAELAEGSKPSMSRVATEAGLSAIPLSKIFRAGSPLLSAGRGALYAGGGTAAREVLGEGQAPDPRAIGTSALTGGVLGGILGKFLGLGKAAESEIPKFSDKASYEAWKANQGKAIPPATYEVVPTSQTAVTDATGNPTTLKITGKGGNFQPQGVPEGTPAYSGRVPVVGTPASASGRVQKVMAKEAAAAEKEAAAAQKEADNAARLQQIEDIQSGREPGDWAARESISATGPGGEKLSVSRPWSAPEPEVPSAPAPKSAGLAALLGISPEAAPVAAKAAEQAAPVTAQAAPAAESPLLKILKTREGATGLNYRLAKEAEKAGEIPSSQFAREAHMRSLEDKIAANAAKTEAPAAQVLTPLQEAEAKFKAFAEKSKAEMFQKAEEAKARVAAQAAPAAAEAAVPAAAEAPVEPWVTEQLGIVDRLQKLADEQKGAASIGALTHLGLGAAGAAVGAATDPFDNKLQSAAFGGAMGALAPNLLKLGVRPEVANAVEKSPGSLADKAKAIYHELPQVQRFNYLSDLTGLAANSFAGPYGSAVMASIEKGLAGDARGWAALKELTPMNFLREHLNAHTLEEAQSAIGRAEGVALGPNASITQKIIAAPGRFMTAGDIAARNILQRAGFTEGEARVITLTGEPESALGRNIVRFGKAKTEGGKPSALAQLMFPFKRTTTNIFEQGLQRIPGAGFVAQAARDVPDPIKTQLVQQGIGGAVGAGSAALGASLDPESAKTARRFVTNFGGQYSLPAGIGFAMGQAARKGKSPVAGALNEAKYSLPLPTAEPLYEWGKLGASLLDPEVEASLPRGAVPGVVTDLGTILGMGRSALSAGQPNSPAAATPQEPDLIFRRR